MKCPAFIGWLIDLIASAIWQTILFVRRLALACVDITFGTIQALLFGFAIAAFLVAGLTVIVAVLAAIATAGSVLVAGAALIVLPFLIAGVVVGPIGGWTACVINAREVRESVWGLVE